MYVIDPSQCRHPAQIRGKDGKLVCLTCSKVISPESKLSGQRPDGSGRIGDSDFATGEVKPAKAKKPKETPKDPSQGQQEDDTDVKSAY